MLPNSAFSHAVGSFRVPIAPPTTAPGDEPTASFRVNCEWLPFIRGALTQLLLPSTWDTDDPDLLLDIQARVYALTALLGQDNCDMCDCLEFTNNGWQKQVSDGHGGSILVPIDPRTEGTVPPPWPTPPSGQTGNCLSGANNADMFKQSMNLIINTIGGAVIIAQIIILVVDLFELALPFVGEALALANEWALAIVGAGVTVLAATFQGADADTIYAKLSCIIGCHANADGRVTAAGIDFIIADFTEYLPTSPADAPQQLLWSFFVTSWLQNQGPNGLTLLGKAAGIVSSDCSGCDCGWCYTYDFTTGAHGASSWDGVALYGAELVAGHGWKNHAGNPRADVQILFGSSINWTHARMEYELVDGPGGGSAITMYSLPITTVFSASPLSVGIHQVASGVGSFTGDNVSIQLGMGAGYTAYLKSVTLMGDGTNPLGSNNCG